MIKMAIFDIDGVITDGKVIVDSKGNEYKNFSMQDVDAIYRMHACGIKIAAITGEATPIVDYFQSYFPWDYFYKGCKDKVSAIKEIEADSKVALRDIGFVGDGVNDIPALKYVGFSVCPANAIDEAKHVSDIVLKKSGGNGCLWELIEFLELVGNSGQDDEI